MGPYRTTWSHMGPNRTTQSHMGPYRTIQNHMGPYGATQCPVGPYGALWDHTGPPHDPPFYPPPHRSQCIAALWAPPPVGVHLWGAALRALGAVGLPHRERPPRPPPRGSELPLRPLPHGDLRLHRAGLGAGLLWGAGGVRGGINRAGTPPGPQKTPICPLQLPYRGALPHRLAVVCGRCGEMGGGRLRGIPLNS